MIATPSAVAAEDGLLRDLARLAARAELPLWCLDAIAAEVSGGPPSPGPVSAGVLAARRLGAAGYSACPVCHAPVPSPEALTASEGRRVEAAEARDAWERAGSLGGRRPA